VNETNPCERCGKPATICVCDRVVPMPTRTRVLILQHPREDDVALGTARLAACALPSCRLLVGLSWPSLEKALGDEPVDRGRWAVVFAGKVPEHATPEQRGRSVLVLDRRGAVLDAPDLDGVVVLDGTWSQAKALWWRNPWLLKLGRVLLQPKEPTLYGRLRRAPRREWVSTLEAIAETLPALGEPPAVRDELRRLMRTMVQRARDAGVRDDAG
jgi:hypothetical protein